jgi:hypothetical protein
MLNLFNEYLSMYFLDFIDYFQKIFSKLINWAINKDKKLPEKLKKNKFYPKRIDAMDNFYTADNMDEYDLADEGKLNKGLQILIICIVIGITIHYYCPDFYGNCFDWIKGKSSGGNNPPKDPGPSNYPGSLKGDSKGTTSTAHWNWMKNSANTKSYFNIPENNKNIGNLASDSLKGKGSSINKTDIFNNPNFFNPKDPLDKLHERISNVLRDTTLSSTDRRFVLETMHNRIYDDISDTSSRIEIDKIFTKSLTSIQLEIAKSTNEPVQVIKTGLSWLKKDSTGLKSLFGSPKSTPISSPVANTPVSSPITSPPISSPANSGNTTPIAELTPKPKSVDLPNIPMDHSYISNQDSVELMNRLMDLINKKK